MELLTAVFSRLLSMALTVLPVIVAVLLVRLALQRAPRKYSYALWLAVGFRLACPVSTEDLWSIFELPGLYELAESTGAVGTGMVDELPRVAAALAPAAPSVTAPAVSGGAVSSPSVPVEEAAQAIPLLSDSGAISWSRLLLQIGAVVWLLGVIALLAVGVLSLVRLRRRLAGAVWCGGEVWESEAVPTPFVLGFFRPRIYLPPGLTGTERTCVLVHERHHIRRGDPWWKLLGWCILAAYWWDPAVWLCWVLFCRDMEMSCDEAVLSALGDQTKTGYSEALVSFALTRRVPAALAFGEHDAARRVRHVLNWKKETPRIGFLAFAAVFLAVTACISNPAPRPDSGFVRGTEGTDGVWSLEYQFPEDTRSFVFYREVYRYGELEDRSCMVMDGMAENEEGVTKREGAFPLEIFREDGKTGVRFSSGSFPTLMPEADGCELVSWTYIREQTELWLGDSAAIAAVLYSDAETGIPAMSCDALNQGDPAELLAACPVAVVLRLAVSRQMADTLAERIETGVIGLPAVLYGLRMDRALEGDLPTLPLQETLDQDLSGVRAILEALGVPDLENCTLELGIHPLYEDAGTLRVFCESPADLEAYQNAMITASKVVPALVGDVDQVMYGYGQNGGRNWQTLYTKDGSYSLDKFARELGWRDIHTLGQTLAGLQALVDDLWEDLPAVTAADALAQRLWALRDGSEMELEKILLDQGIPGVDGQPSWVPAGSRTIARTDAQTLSFRFDDPEADTQAVGRAMEKKAVVLLALREELTKVIWEWTPEGSDAPAATGELTAAKADELLAAAGMMDGVKAMGASPAALAQLLEWLENWTAFQPLTAGELYDMARTLTPEAMAAEVVCRGPWADPYLEGAFTVSWEGDGLLLQFTTEDAWERAVSVNRLASDGLLLLALYPQLREVRAWSPYGRSYTWVTSETAERSLPEGMTIGDCGASPEAFAALVELLAANAPASTREEPFTDILGYDGVLVTVTTLYGWSQRTYYAVSDDGSRTAVAASFGYGEPEDYTVDLDGDGAEELVCNVTFGADGGREVYVYQRRDGGVYLGTCRFEELPDFVPGGGLNNWVEYDLDAGCFRLHYRTSGAEEFAEVEVRGLEGLSFEKFSL